MSIPSGIVLSNMLALLTSIETVGAGPIFHGSTHRAAPVRTPLLHGKAASSAPLCTSLTPLLGAGPNSFVGVPLGNNVAGGAGTESKTTVTEYSGVVAGANNAACSSYTGIVAGVDNVVGSGDFMHGEAFNSIVGGGAGNSIHASESAFIGAGSSNQIESVAPQRISADESAIVAGDGNFVGEASSFVGAGTSNVITATLCALDNCVYTSGFIGSGDHNTVNGSDSAIVAGILNSVTGAGATIAGGQLNVSQARQTFIGSGYGNRILVGANGGANGSGLAVINGGSFNTIAANAPGSAYFGVIGGGTQNTVTGAQATIAGGVGNTASGTGAVVPGGSSNTAAGYNSFAAGTNSYAGDAGSFVFSDNAGGAKRLATNGPNQYLVRASGGVAFYSNSGLTAGVVLRPGSGSWSSLSDRAAKTNVTALDPSAVLAKVAALPVTEWSYRSEDVAIRHVGPMAGDFYAAFGIGEDDRHITTIDEDGIALAAVKGLYAQNTRLSAKNTALEQELQRLEARDAKLEAEVAALLSRVPANAAASR